MTQSEREETIAPIHRILVPRDEAARLMSESIRTFLTKVQKGIYPQAKNGGGKMGIRGARWSVQELRDSQAG